MSEKSLRRKWLKFKGLNLQEVRLLNALSANASEVNMASGVHSAPVRYKAIIGE